MATHSSILAWRIPWTKEPGGLQSTGVTQSWTGLSDRAHMHMLCDLGRWERGRMQLRTELCQGQGRGKSCLINMREVSKGDIFQQFLQQSANNMATHMCQGFDHCQRKTELNSRMAIKADFIQELQQEEKDFYIDLSSIPNIAWMSNSLQPWKKLAVERVGGIRQQITECPVLWKNWPCGQLEAYLRQKFDEPGFLHLPTQKRH